MKKTLLLLASGLLLVLVSAAPVAAQWFHRIGHVSKSRTKKAEHSDRHVKHRDKQKTKKRNPDHDERRRRQESKRQAKRRAEGSNTLPAATAPEKPTP